MRRREWAKLLTLAAAIACSPKSAPSPDAHGQNRTLRAALSLEVTNFYLGDSLQKNVWNFNLLFAQALFLRTETSEIVGDLAESLEIAAPELVRIPLKAGSTFHDGRAVTCDDVVWSFDDANRSESPYRSTFAAIEKWSCRDGVFEIRLKRPIYALVERLVSGIRIYPKGAYPERSQRPIGSG